MLQTLEALHLGAGYAHLDISCNNVMWRDGYTEPWDQIRLIDLGFAQPCFKGIQTV